MQVVKEQIMRALTTKPSSLDQFKSKLQNLSYTEILKIRQSERMNQEDFQSRPILELKEKIQPEILELIKQQRLNRLVEGTCFRKLNSRRRQGLKGFVTLWKQRKCAVMPRRTCLFSQKYTVGLFCQMHAHLEGRDSSALELCMLYTQLPVFSEAKV
uniref:Engulfment and cell motility 1 n=1 Tax=Pavo cristatus TaxID=9049 RepID=A0A8C9G2I2_PAVCR